MKVGIYQREPTPPHRAVADAVQVGALSAGELAWKFDRTTPEWLNQDLDIVVVFGIGGDAKQVWDAYPKAIRVLLDKPYVRRAQRKGQHRYSVVRVSVNDFQPLAYFQKIPRPADRWNALGIRLTSRAKFGSCVLLDGASNKYCLWNGLGDWTVWGQEMVNRIRQHTDLPIIYRPRPSHNLAPKVEGAELSEGPLSDDFDRARVVVSHGGNIGFDAVVSGLSHFAIGNSAARPVSETSWFEVGRPSLPKNSERLQWLYDLAYTQWTLDEFESGAAWSYIRSVVK